HGRAMNPVPARLVPYVEDRVADSLRAGPKQTIGPREADAHDVHQRISRVFRGEGDLSPHGRASKTVAVPADARHHAVDEMARPRVAGITETKGVQEGDRSGPHGENVAQNPAHAGGRALKGLDERGVIVALNLEYDRPAVANVDGAGIFARSLEHGGATLRQPTQEDPRMLVGTVLRPQCGEEAQLGVGRDSAQ